MTLSDEVKKLEEKCYSQERQILKLTQEIAQFINAYDSDAHETLLPKDRSYHTKGLRSALAYVYVEGEGDQ